MECKICNSFTTNKKYCSRKCQYEGYKEKKGKRVLIKCQICNKEFYFLESRLKYRNCGKFCSKKCKNKNQSKKFSGNSNPWRNLSEHSELKRRNSLRENWKKNFKKRQEKQYEILKEKAQINGFWNGWSSQSRKNRIETYLKRYGFEHNWSNKECREKCEKTCLERYGKNSWEIASDAVSFYNTDIEKIVEKLLIKNNIVFKKQFRLYYKFDNKYSFKIYDFFLKDYNLLIECDGDYWHANENFITKLNLTLIKNISNDEFKNELAAFFNYKLIRFWGSEIRNINFEQKFLEKIWKEK